MIGAPVHPHLTGLSMYYHNFTLASLGTWNTVLFNNFWVDFTPPFFMFVQWILFVLASWLQSGIYLQGTRFDWQEQEHIWAMSYYKVLNTVKMWGIYNMLWLLNTVKKWEIYSWHKCTTTSIWVYGDSLASQLSHFLSCIRQILFLGGPLNWPMAKVSESVGPIGHLFQICIMILSDIERFVQRKFRTFFEDK